MAIGAIATLAAFGCSFEHGVAATSDGKLGDGGNTDASPCAAIDLTAGNDHTCAVAASGKVFCWGRGTDGQLGNDPLSYQCVTNTLYCQKTPLEVRNLAGITAVGAGAAHTCVSTGTQTYCWGRNSSQQYGDNSVATSTTPKLIHERAGASAIDGGNAHTCSLTNGTLGCSGANAEGQIGNASIVQQGTPAPVMSGVASFSLGLTTTCAVDANRKLYCWGRNAYKTIDSSGMIRTVPTQVDGGNDVASIAVGADHVCAAFVGGAAKCWGLNNQGQIGNGTTNGTSAQPMTTLSITDVVEVAANRNHSCVRTMTGDVYCFGEGFSPTPALIVTGATKLTAGGLHDCAIVTGGAVRCWGDQTYGQLGNNVDMSSRATTPQSAALCP
jgi:alpha-tubulin suppressor-like RCC1 family protein